MARKKGSRKSKGHRGHRRGRVGAIGHFNVMEALETGLGLVIGSTLGTAVQKYATRIPQKLLAGGQMVVGLMNTQRPNKIFQGAAWGFAGSGAVALAHDTGILHGIDEVMSGITGGSSSREIDYNVNGMPNREVLSGMPNDTVLSGPEGGEMPQQSLSADSPLYVPVMGF